MVETEVDRVRKVRTTCRRSATKLVTKAEELLKYGIEGVDTGGIGKLKHFQTELSAKLSELKEADKVILNDLTEKEASEEDIDKELDDGSESGADLVGGPGGPWPPPNDKSSRKNCCRL